MSGQNFYLNDKLVSLHIFYTKENTEWYWGDTFLYTGIFKDKIKKLKYPMWINSSMTSFYFLSKEYESFTFKTDEELLEDLSETVFILNKKLYNKPYIRFTYVNNDKRIKFFDTDLEVQTFFNEFKSKFEKDKYITFS